MASPKERLEKDRVQFIDDLSGLIFDASDDYTRMMYSMGYLNWLGSKYSDEKLLKTYNRFLKMNKPHT